MYDIFSQCIADELVNRLEKIGNVVIQKEQILNNNGTVKKALRVMVEGYLTSPLVYMESYYEDFCHGKALIEIANEIADELLNHYHDQEAFEKLLQLKNNKDRIIFSLISKERNRELLQTVPWIPYQDMAMIFRIYFGSHGRQMLTAVIRDEYAENRNLTSEELFELAKVNTPRLLPYRFRDIEEVLSEIVPLELVMEVVQADVPKLYILSNEKGVGGAVCMAYEGVLKRISEQLGVDNLVIFPSSTEEVIILPDKDQDETKYPFFQEMVKEVNMTEVPDEIFLYDQVYLYSRDADEVRLWTRKS